MVNVVCSSGWESQKRGCLKGPPHSTSCETCFVSLYHYVMFVFFKVVVKMDVVRPNPLVLQELNLLSRGDMIVDSVVIEDMASGQVSFGFWV